MSDEDYRWVNPDGTKCTYLETLEAACAYFGTFCGRWHDNEYWKALAAKAKTMTEAEAEAAVRQYEREADEDYHRWRMMQ